MSDEIKELLPCPFCGGAAKFTYHNGGWPDHCCNVQCSDWKCPGRSGGRSSEDAAAELWNTRAALAPIDAATAARVLLDDCAEGEGFLGELCCYNDGLEPDIDGAWVKFSAVEAALRALSGDG